MNSKVGFPRRGYVPVLLSAVTLVLSGCSGATGDEGWTAPEATGHAEEGLTGGTTAPSNAAPFMAVIHHGPSTTCFGAYLGGRNVVSTGTCVMNPDGFGGFTVPPYSAITVTLGDRNLAAADSTEQNFAIDGIRYPATMNPTAQRDDIVILRLTSTPVPSAVVAPITDIPMTPPGAGQAVTMWGWKTPYTTSPNPLQMGNTTIRHCSPNDPPAPSHAFCAGAATGGPNASGLTDWGLPLTSGTFLVGLSALSLNTPTTFVDLHALRTWILANEF